MKYFNQLAAVGSLLVLSVASASYAYADSISLGSFATGTAAASLGFSASQTAMNFAGFTAFATPPPVASTPAILSGTDNSYALSANGVWAAPAGNSTWIGSAANAGPGGSDPAYGYYQFTTLFTAAGGSYTGSLDVMGDDTVEVLLNGVTLVPFGSLGADTYCADGGPTCSAEDIVSLSGIDLNAGADANIFTFVVEQAGVRDGNDPSGVDFTANFVSAVAAEPSSLILLGTGMIGFAGALRQRRRIRSNA